MGGVMMQKFVDGILVDLTPEEMEEISAQESAYLNGEQRRKAIAEIQFLEAQVTSRRLREALLTQEGAAWLVNINSQITSLRGNL